MKKTLNTTALESQLAGSVFFRKTKPTEAPENRQPREEEPSREVPIKPHSPPQPHHSPAPPATPKRQLPAKKSKHRTDTPNERTVQPNGDTERSSVLAELEEGVRESKRPTERYSFEIYVDMKEKIEDIQYRYKKKTGKKLSASRIIREALEVYFDKIEEAI